MKKAIADEIDAYLRNVDTEEVAAGVFSDLELLTREDLWDRSGPSAAGYDDPVDVAWEMVEEAVRPHLREIGRCWTVGMKEEAFRCCLGVLAGLYDFETRSRSSFKEWAQDDPREAFRWVRKIWNRKYRDETLTARSRTELTARCPGWA